MKFCVNCGNEIPEGTKFCPSCGKKVEDVPVQTAGAGTSPVQQSNEPPVQQSYEPPVEQSYEPPVQQSYEPPVQQSYEPPAEQSYEPPVQQSYEPPAEQSYEPPAEQSYEPPVQQSYEPPVQQSYEPPAEQSYEPPVQQSYEPPAEQSYEPPVQQSYEPPVQQSYQPPVQQSFSSGGGGNFVPPVNSGGAGGKKSRKRPLIIGICAVVILAVALGAFFLVRGGGDKQEEARKEYIGRYEGVSCLLDGEEVGAEGEWIELKKDGKAQMFLEDEKYDAKWEMDGRKITIIYDKDERYQGKIKNGVLTLEMGEDLEYTFRLKGSEDEDPEETEAEESPIGYWDGLRIDSDDPDSAMGEADLQGMKDLGMQIYLLLYEDGTGYISMGFPEKITWEETIITVTEYDENCTFVIEDDMLKLTIDTETVVFVRGEGDPPVPTEPEVPDITDPPETEETIPEPEADYSWWNGDWYGWWIVSDASESLIDMKDRCWDCCGSITVWGSSGSLYLFDEDNEPGKAFCEADVFFGEGWTDKGCMFSVSGDFMGGEIGYAEWSVDPYSNCMGDFGDVIAITGKSVNPEDENDWFEYMIYLRPWGTYWDDVSAMDTSDAPYQDMMPPRYWDWYVPAIDAGETMPDFIPTQE